MILGLTTAEFWLTAFLVGSGSYNVHQSNQIGQLESKVESAEDEQAKLKKRLQLCGRDKAELERLAKVAAENYHRRSKETREVFDSYGRDLAKIMEDTSVLCSNDPVGVWFWDFLDLQNRSLESSERSRVLQPGTDTSDKD